MGVLIDAIDAGRGVVGLLPGATGKPRQTDLAFLLMKVLLSLNEEIGEASGQERMQSGFSNIAQVM